MTSSSLVQLGEATTELLQQLIRFDTVNPPGNERFAQEFLRGRLAAAGFDCELVGAEKGRPNLIARMAGRGDGPRLCLLGHVDTVLADPGGVVRRPVVGGAARRYVWGRGAST